MDGVDTHNSAWLWSIKFITNTQSERVTSCCSCSWYLTINFVLLSLLIKLKTHFVSDEHMVLSNCMDMILTFLVVVLYSVRVIFFHI